MRCILDIETDGINPTKIHVVVLKDIDNGKIYSFTKREDFKSFLDHTTIHLVAGHNLIAYDLRWLSALWDCHITREVVRDTLVLSRLLDQQRSGGHSLEAWGETLGFPKTHFDQWDRYSDEMLQYCINDVHLNHKLYEFLEKQFRYPSWEASIKVEHEMAYICLQMELDGFSFNTQRAEELLTDINGLIEALDKDILDQFKPVRKLDAVYKLRTKKDGGYVKHIENKLRNTDCEIVDGELHVYTWETFNPQSQRQICERLKGYWSPTDKTDGHKNNEDKAKEEHYKLYGWKISETNLGTLSEDAPQAAHSLVKRIMLGARQRTLIQWLACVDDKNYIHSTQHPLGTWTGRLSSTNPNIQNISAEKTIKYKTEELRKLAIRYGGEFRKLFISAPGYQLVGTDMEGAHLRLFAHLISDDELIKALVSGDKKQGTDPHTLNKKRLGSLCPDRDLAKTFVFTFLNGGGVNKVMEIFGCSYEEAKRTLDGFIRSYPGLLKLKKEQIPEDAKRGWFRGLDGRKVLCDSEHKMIAGYLQSGEAVVIKHTLARCIQHFNKKKLPVRPVVVCHDEIVFEVKDEPSLIDYVGTYSSNMIKQVGADFNIRCPLAGEWKAGVNWLEAH